jgi:5-formyltetrahydrofolate cyclo-ligase
MNRATHNAEAEKRALRERVRALWRSAARGEVRRRGLLAQRRLTELPEFSDAAAVCCYLPLPDEAETGRIVSAARRGRKTVSVPAARPDGSYAPAALAPRTALAAGPRGVRQPARPAWVALTGSDVVVVPGRAFDVRGGRLGRGGGHYDSLLRSPALRRAFRVGLALEFQVFGQVPMGRRDVRMHAVVTEKRTIRSARGAPRKRTGR